MKPQYEDMAKAWWPILRSPVQEDLVLAATETGRAIRLAEDALARCAGSREDILLKHTKGKKKNDLMWPALGRIIHWVLYGLPDIADVFKYAQPRMLAQAIENLKIDVGMEVEFVGKKSIISLEIAKVEELLQVALPEIVPRVEHWRLIEAPLKRTGKGISKAILSIPDKETQSQIATQWIRLSSVCEMTVHIPVLMHYVSKSGKVSRRRVGAIVLFLAILQRTGRICRKS